MQDGLPKICNFWAVVLLFCKTKQIFIPQKPTLPQLMALYNKLMVFNDPNCMKTLISSQFFSPNAPSTSNFCNFFEKYCKKIDNNAKKLLISL